jgi:hypothetical protein
MTRMARRITNQEAAAYPKVVNFKCSVETFKCIEEKAEQYKTSRTGLVRALLEEIAKSNLWSAILDV